jgi:hypothetical protein
VPDDKRSSNSGRGGPRRGSEPSRGGSGRPASGRSSSDKSASGRSSSGRSSSGRPTSGGSSSGGSSAGRSSSGRSSSGRTERRDTGRRDAGRDTGRSGGGRPGAPESGTGARGLARRSDAESRSEDQARYDGPPIDEQITGRELDRSVLQQLKGLPEKLAARVARHLVAAGQLLETDPQTAYQHTLAARSRASRIAVVREACGEAAYAAEEYATALAELRAARRMNGANDYLPVMADCERALGRPEKALSLAKSPSVGTLEQGLRAEMTIVEAGARRDLGEIDGALRTLESAPLRSRSRAPWVTRLRYAYADTLQAAGRTDDAIVWFHRTVGTDGEGITDAVERLAALEGTVLTDTDTDADSGGGSEGR